MMIEGGREVGTFLEARIKSELRDKKDFKTEVDKALCPLSIAIRPKACV